MSVRYVRSTLSAAAAAALVACGGGGAGDGEPVARGTASSVTPSSHSGSLQPAPANISGNVTCLNWVIDAVAVDSITVPANAACQLRGTRLNGSIYVNAQAVLDAADVQVNGGLQADGAADVVVYGDSRFGGSVQIKQGGSASIRNARIGGDLQIDAQRGAVAASGNRVTGSLQAVANRGGLIISANTMNGNLQCKENAPAPIASGNAAASFQDQCAQGGAGGGGQPPPPVLSGNVFCNNFTIGAVSLDTVTVPAGASCALNSTRLKGSILIGANAMLNATDVAVTGSIQADGAASVAIMGRSAGGSVQIKQGGSASINGMSITGDLQIDAQRGPVSAGANRITGNLQAVANRGGVSLIGNAINGGMQCKENVPAPIGSGNTAALKEDQCLGL